jgi:hypothetical protein
MHFRVFMCSIVPESWQSSLESSLESSAGGMMAYIPKG